MAAPNSAAIVPVASPSTAPPSAQRPHDDGATGAPGVSLAPASDVLPGVGAGGVVAGGIVGFVGGAGVEVPGMAPGEAPARRLGTQCLALAHVAPPGHPPLASQALWTMVFSNVCPPAQPPFWVTVSTRTQSGWSTQAIGSLGGLAGSLVRSESQKRSQSASTVHVAGRHQGPVWLTSPREPVGHAVMCGITASAPACGTAPSNASRAKATATGRLRARMCEQ